MAQKIETIQKNITTIETWMAKKSEFTTKKIAMLNKAGILKGVTVENIFESSDIADAELKHAMAVGCDNQKIIDTLYSLSCLADDVQRKERELKRLKRIELEMLQGLENMTPEQLERKKQREMERALHQYIRDEMDNIKIPSLETWLENYRIAYIEMVERHLTGWEKSDALHNTDNAVRNQKMNLLIRSFPVVGKLQNVDFGTIGMNGEFNGVVTGENGTATIRTILAGGYNIQRLHYRVLVN